MAPQVDGQATVESKILRTNRAGEWFLTCVDPQVGVQHGHLSETFPTGATGVRPLVGVAPQVCVEFGLIFKSLSTCVAPEGLVTCVDVMVDLWHIAGESVLAPALWSSRWFGVTVVALLIGRRVDEGVILQLHHQLLTCLTGMKFFFFPFNL